MRTQMTELLTTWADRLLELQLPDSYGPGLAGGILCPACANVHGRCADAVYALMHLAHATGKDAYSQAAIRLQAWADANVTEPSGAWRNDVMGPWTGITVFGTIALGESLRLHGEILPADVREAWQERLRAAADFLDDTMTMDTGNINYPLTCAASLAVASKVLDDQRYADKARELAHAGLDYFTEGGILFGEGHPQRGISPRDCRPVDLGYNVEETIPGMVLYAHLLGDADVLAAMEHAARAHLAFMLPDGGWDNSWGTRNFKWTYWGSRTSDGCQAGYLMLSDRDPVFAEAARRNLDLLQRCTHDGLLYGGPHLRDHGDLPCVHHTFCHVKALAGALDWLNERDHTGHFTRVALPREVETPTMHIPEIDTWLAAVGPWRATVTACDVHYRTPEVGHPSGGSLSMLYHMDIGPVLTASMSEYTPIEPHNMQRHRDESYLPLTPRLELQQDDETFASVFDEQADVRVEEGDGRTTLTVAGHLRNAAQEHPSQATIPFRMTYELTAESVVIRVAMNVPAKNVRLVLPVIARSSDAVTAESETAVSIARPGGTIHVSTDARLSGAVGPRAFNLVPGVEAVRLSADVAESLSIRINCAAH